MALMRCPGCNRRVSSRAERCAHCGTAIAGANAEQQRAGPEERHKRSRARLRFQLLVAISLFVVGAVWLIFLNLQGSAERTLPALLSVAGLVWYAAVRLLLWVKRR